MQFDTHYVSAPVCAASRASIWSGRYPHNIPHAQASTGMHVNGAWNNYEGLPHNYSQKIQDVLNASGYDILISGKTDWSTGGHSLDNRLEAWTLYTDFPYDASSTGTGGFATEIGMCVGNGTVTPTDTPSRGGYYAGDWRALNETTAWIRARGAEQLRARSLGTPIKPFFAYQGMNIVHPAYFTSAYWFNKVNLSAVTVPEWHPLDQLHPCDYQASMLKGCLPHNASTAPQVYAKERRRRVRAIYYAMILEFDSMVGAYVTALEQAGLTASTVLIVTSDHGDMNMEHQQFYKMVQYDASSRVPLVIRLPPGSAHVANGFITQPTSHIDLFPTILDLAQVPPSAWPSALQGESLAPFLASASASASAAAAAAGTAAAVTAAAAAAVPRKRPFSVFQFHGCDIGMSWFSVMDGHYKYTVFGTGNQHPPQLFDLLRDPGENQDIAAQSSSAPILARLDALLRSVVDYPAVATDVAGYTHTSLGAWVNATPNWKTIMQQSRWKPSFDVNINASIAAVETYLAAPPKISKCRSAQVWPPQLSGSGGV